MQFGFRTGHSTEHALVSLSEKIKSTLDSGKIGCGIFIDLQKAFDTTIESYCKNWYIMVSGEFPCSGFSNICITGNSLSR